KLMLKYALDVKNLDSENIQATVLPGEAKYIDNLWYYVSDKEESDKVIENMFTDHEIVNKNKSIIND
ncbi:MAG: LytR family transcriptional regulator, partial [Tissierellia bacterium]|nr:LytR family transcriptional regulator [Tissierellia bacterium]